MKIDILHNYIHHIINIKDIIMLANKDIKWFVDKKIESIRGI